MLYFLSVAFQSLDVDVELQGASNPNTSKLRQLVT
jgi:hypothetical protein